MRPVVADDLHPRTRLIYVDFLIGKTKGGAYDRRNRKDNRELSTGRDGFDGLGQRLKHIWIQ